MRHRFVGVAAVAALALGLGLVGVSTTASAAPGDSAATAAQESRAAQAEAALTAARALFATTPAGSERTAYAARGRAATLVLRDLAAYRSALTGADRQAADELLARPTDGNHDQFGDGYTVARAAMKHKCGVHVCIHYVKTSIDRVPLKDTAPANGIPDYVDFALATMEHVHTTYTGAGYKGPKLDLSSANHGPNNKPDIYLADIGDQNLYGYCTTDDPAAAPGTVAVSAYCVLDNDYKATQFPAHTPKDNFRVTAAHEYFHAVQYHYDLNEDSWFMEASATWAEDELYDNVNDNVGYLKYGQLGVPTMPLDRFFDLFHYGNWIFPRYLTEKFPARFPDAPGGLPVLMLEIWKRLQVPGIYAIKGIGLELVDRGTTFHDQYALFAEAGRRRTAFSEGVANNYQIKPLADSATLTSPGQLAVSASPGLSHMTSATYRLTPDETSLADPSWALQLDFNLADLIRGSAAIVTSYPEVGDPTVSAITLDSTGGGTTTVPFSSSSVRFVEITLVNASDRFNCGVNPNSPFSCMGNPLDQNLTESVQATAIPPG